MKIYVDADACPVKDVIIFEATNAEIPVTLVTSFSHYSNAQQPKGVETIYVDSEQICRLPNYAVSKKKI